MPYFSNKAVNRLNIHYGLHMLGWNLAGNFYIVFLLSRGFSAVQVILTFAGMLGLRLILRPMMLYFGPRFGMHRTILIGLFFCMCQYTFLARVQGLDKFFFCFCLAQALADIFYWTSYHSAFAIVGDNSHRGKQVGIREALSTTTAVLAPVVGGWLLDHAGARTTYGLAALCDFLAVIPLLRLPPICVSAKAPKGIFKAGRRALVLFSTDSWIAAGFSVVWAIVLFAGTGRGFTAYGGALTLAGIVSIAGGIFLGRLIDNGHGHRAVIMNAVLLTAAIILRATAQPTLGSVYAVAMTSALVTASYMPTLMTAIYTMMSEARCPFRLVLMMESGWDIGGILGALTCSALLSCGVPLGFAVASALLGVPVQVYLLRRFYKQKKAEQKSRAYALPAEAP